MFGWNSLKKHISVTATSVDCPVLGCDEAVDRQRKKFVWQDRFVCPKHGICISPSTFEYADEKDNMLWTSESDLKLWSSISAKGVKRESRLARDNSEDAVTWNVFRYLETRGQLGPLLSSLASKRLDCDPRVIYWSFCQSTQQVHTGLAEAATTFGELRHRRSEPDLILEDDGVLAFVENKFGSSNRTRPSDPNNPRLYPTGADGWFARVFRNDASFSEVAVDKRLYELMRLWLLGSWLAAQSGKRFFLVNIVREGARQEADIDRRFGAVCCAGPERAFIRCSWERIYSEFVAMRVGDPHADRLAEYMRNKTLGYAAASGGTGGRLRRAFDLPTI